MKDDPAHALALLRDLELINRRTEREFGRRPAAGGRSPDIERVARAPARTALASNIDSSAAAARSFDAEAFDTDAFDAEAFATGACDLTAVAPADSPLE